MQCVTWLPPLAGARGAVDRLLHLPRRRGRDDAAHLLALHRLPRLQGQLHHVVVRLPG